MATWILTITRNLAVDVVRADSEQPIEPEALTHEGNPDAVIPRCHIRTDTSDVMP